MTYYDIKLSNIKYFLPELSALTGLRLFEIFAVLCCTVDDLGFSVECDSVGLV